MSLGLQEAVPGRPAKQRFWGEPALWGLALACLGHRQGLSCARLMGEPPSPTQDPDGQLCLFSRPLRP